MTTFTGQAGVLTHSAVVLKGALKMWVNHKIKPSRAWTPARMLAKATEITGVKFKRGQYLKAIEALEDWLEADGTTGN